MISKELNMELRSEVLEMALTVEHAVMQLIIACLSVGLPKPKALSNSSSSLSFKNKIDLLFDVEMVEKKEHETLLLLMEFRNQFLHNYECSTFTKAAELLDGKGKRLLTHGVVSECLDMEERYKDSFRRLHIRCLDIVLEAFQKRQQQMRDRREVVNNLTDFSSYLIEKDTEIFQKVIQRCVSKEGESPDLTTFKVKLATFLFSQQDELTSTEEYKKLSEQLQSSTSEQRVKNFYK